METVKNWLFGFAVCLAFVLMLWLLCFCFARPWYYRLFYPWDRFSGTVQVELDGEPASRSAQTTTGCMASNSWSKDWRGRSI